MTGGPPAELRLSTPGDLDAIVRVAPGLFDHPVRADRTVEFLSDPRHHLALALVGGEVVGMASGVHYVHPDQPPQLFINEVGVLPDHRGSGIGRRLVALLCEHGRSLGCVEAWVATEPDNMAARRAYASAGGVEAGEPFVMFNFRLAGRD